MSQQSVRTRGALYFAAPSLSGPPSYGGVPKELYQRVTSIAAISFFAAVLSILIIGGFTGVFLLRLAIAPVVISVVAAFWMLMMTQKRRDALSILKESRRFEKEEKKL